jgi:hypothetical protein
MKEIWKPIVGYDGRYLVSSLGRVKSCERIIYFKDRNGDDNQYVKKEIILKPNLSRLYPLVTLTKGTVPKTFSIHRLMAKTFISNPDNKPCVNHIDGDKVNNKLPNLEWCTYSENLRHAYKTKLFPEFNNLGSKNGRSILNEEAVLTIRELFKHMIGIKQYKSLDLAEIFDVSKVTVVRIVDRKNWLVEAE